MKASLRDMASGRMRGSLEEGVELPARTAPQTSTMKSGRRYRGFDDEDDAPTNEKDEPENNGHSPRARSSTACSQSDPSGSPSIASRYQSSSALACSRSSCRKHRKNASACSRSYHLQTHRECHHVVAGTVFIDSGNASATPPAHVRIAKSTNDVRLHG